jgi:hypothetical protein
MHLESLTLNTAHLNLNVATTTSSLFLSPNTFFFCFPPLSFLPSFLPFAPLAFPCISCSQLYRTVYLNFVTRIERTLLEKLAQELVNNNCVSMVSKIYDQYLDVIALEPGLFTLNIKDSFTQYNAPSLSEAQIRFVT